MPMDPTEIASSSTATTCGAGLQPSDADADWHMGHMWLFWTAPSDSHPPFRGYYPDGSDIPREVWDNPKKLRPFLMKNAVQGIYKVDRSAQSLMEELDAGQRSHRQRTWAIGPAQKFKLESICRLPRTVIQVASGKYSCNDDLTDCHNCSSWAIEVLCRTMDDDKFIVCTSPKRLKRVEAAIWGDNLFPLAKARGSGS